MSSAFPFINAISNPATPHAVFISACMDLSTSLDKLLPPGAPSTVSGIDLHFLGIVLTRGAIIMSEPQRLAPYNSAQIFFTDSCADPNGVLHRTGNVAPLPALEWRAFAALPANASANNKKLASLILNTWVFDLREAASASVLHCRAEWETAQGANRAPAPPEAHTPIPPGDLCAGNP